MNDASTISDDTTSAISTSKLLRRVFYRPSEVFAAQKQRQTWGRILFLLLAIHLADMTISDLSPTQHESVGSIEGVDIELAKDDSASISSGKPTQNQTTFERDTDFLVIGNESAFKNAVDRLVIALPTVLIAVFTLIGLYILLLIEALYLRIVSVFLRLELNLGQWLALVSWSRIPGDTLVLAMTVVLVATLFVSNEWLGLESSLLKALFYGSTSSSSSFGYFFNIWLIPEIWVVVLQTLGFRDWSGRSTLFSFMIVVTPVLLLHVLLWWLVV